MKPIPDLLAEFSAWRAGRAPLRSKLVVGLGEALAAYVAVYGACAHDREAAESRLESLGEGLRRGY